MKIEMEFNLKIEFFFLFILSQIETCVDYNRNVLFIFFFHIGKLSFTNFPLFDRSQYGVNKKVNA